MRDSNKGTYLHRFARTIHLTQKTTNAIVGISYVRPSFVIRSDNVCWATIHDLTAVGARFAGFTDILFYFIDCHFKAP